MSRLRYIWGGLEGKASRGSLLGPEDGGKGAVIECEGEDEDAYLISVSSKICMRCESWRPHLSIGSHLLGRDVRRRSTFDDAVDRIAHHVVRDLIEGS